MTAEGHYVNPQKCHYHWGKVHLGKRRNKQYECCGRDKASTGCSKADVHVWKGRPSFGRVTCYDEFAITSKTSIKKNKKKCSVYALDAEMAFTGFGFEAIRVTVVGLDGRLVYESYIQPEHEIVDYNTRFSGITQRSLDSKPKKSLKEVQNDLMGFINQLTILVGHGLENDLFVLKIAHGVIVDTAILHSNPTTGLRPSLKSLMRSLLGKKIQNSAEGHDSMEDAAASLEIALFEVLNRFKGQQQHNLVQSKCKEQEPIYSMRPQPLTTTDLYPVHPQHHHHPVVPTLIPHPDIPGLNLAP